MFIKCTIKNESHSSKFSLLFVHFFKYFRPDIAYIQNESLSLPALKQTMGNKAVERRKRTQILQKARFKNEVLQ